jgi:hypothetical protein
MSDEQQELELQAEIQQASRILHAMRAEASALQESIQAYERCRDNTEAAYQEVRRRFEVAKLELDEILAKKKAEES